MKTLFDWFEDFLKGCGFIIDGHLEIVRGKDDCK